MALLEFLNNWLHNLGIHAAMAHIVSRVIIGVSVVLLSVAANYVAKRYILKFVHFLARKSRTSWDDLLVEARVFHRVSHLAPALVIFFTAPLLFPTEDFLREITQRVSIAYMVLVVCLVIDALINAGHDIYLTFPVARQRPVKAYLQVVKIFVYLITAIFIIASLFEKSPWALLSGLGAMTAVLMLVFKDSILGFVASIQLAAHNMVRPGDWISMPKFGADGDVIDVTLNTVKVQNWDKTISTIPTYAFISDSFKNWRGMQESGGRRIKRSISLDMNTVRFCTPEMLERFKRFQYLEEHLAKKEQEISAHNREQGINEEFLVNGRRLTNIGVFRAYITEYLAHHPLIHKEMTFLVRQLAPSEKGLPIEIYVFSSDKNWVNYEGIQADIFDHILAAIPEFELRVFQNPSGNDFRELRVAGA